MNAILLYGRSPGPSRAPTGRIHQVLWGRLAAVLLGLGCALAGGGALAADPASDAAWQELLAEPGFLIPAAAPGSLTLPGPSSLQPAQARRSVPVTPPSPDNPDPFEAVNRYAHEFNAFLRQHLLEPVTLTYLEHTTKPVQQGIANVFANLREPITIASNLLLGDVDGASNATTRFLINTTAGIGGYYDAAAEQGYRRQVRTLEEVLCRYAAPAGPYVVLPVLGPATVRDAVGRVTTLVVLWGVLGPVYVPYRLTDIAVQYVELREQLRFIESMSIDPYAAHKSAHMQLSGLRCDQRTEAQMQLFGQ